MVSLRESTEILGRKMENGALHRSKTQLQRTLIMLDAKGDFSGLKEVPDLDYRMDFSTIKVRFPKQSVVVLRFVQPTSDVSAFLGFLDKDTEIVVTHLSTGHFGAGTWAVPMGKVEEKDMRSGDSSLGTAIINSAYREFGEEVNQSGIENDVGRAMIAGSFFDIKTGFLVHVVLDELPNWRKGESLTLKLPDLRENDRATWMNLYKATRLPDMMPGMKMSYKIGLRFIEEQNNSLRNSGRYYDKV
jgi:ADP-ribose pyrophosphatase YjhB (NUDIX family)